MPIIQTTQAFRYELAPTLAQVRTLRLWLDMYRYAYNSFIAARRAWWEANKALPRCERTKQPTAYDLSLNITKRLRAAEALPEHDLPWDLAGLRAVPRNLLTRALDSAEAAFAQWFRCGKSGKWTKPPKFMSRHDVRASHCAMQTQRLRLAECGVRLPKLGHVRLKERTSKLRGRPVSVAIRERAGRWYVSINCVEVPREVPDRTDTERVGVDLGVRKLAVLSTGEVIKESPEVLAGMTKVEKRIKRLQRSMARKLEEAKRLGTWDKHSTSKGYQRVRLKHQRAHLKGASQRLDRSHKLSTRVVTEFRTVVIEDLDLLSMTASASGTIERPGTNVRQKAGLNRSIRSKCFGAIRRQLEYKAHWYGATVETVPQFFASSKTCSRCGNKKQDLGSSEVYKCDVCELVIDRDLNAAINIRDFSPEAQEKLSQGCEGERVNRPKARRGARSGCKDREVKSPEKHVQDPQGKPDAGQTWSFGKGQQ